MGRSKGKRTRTTGLATTVFLGAVWLAASIWLDRALRRLTRIPDWPNEEREAG